MSEATLKKKTRTQYRNMSVGSKNGGFSLNGTRRSQGYVGQTMLGRHFPRTPMRGNEARGSGGCGGKYYRGTIIQSGIPFPSGIDGNSANNDPQVVKLSVIDHNGLIMTKTRWITCNQRVLDAEKNDTLEPDMLDPEKKVVSKAIIKSQGDYIKNKSMNLVRKLSSCNKISFCKPIYKSYGGNPRPFGSVIHYPRAWVSITKTAGKIAGFNKLGPISQFEFISALTGKCILNSKNVVNMNRGPLPGPGNCHR
jgi:hypothetical protein